ncbi:MAG: UPF0149 family protein [Gammaproteobacteria bacterium]
MTTRSLHSIYQLKVTLKGIRPPIWRRLLIASTDNLEHLHVAIQIVMGWSNTHLHEFTVGRNRYGVPDVDYAAGVHDETDYRLDQLFKKEKDKLNYIYDFGDGWQHEVLLEKILPYEHDAILPVCIKGKRACPPDDVGGVGGYELFLETIADPSDAEYESMLEWIGGDFDSEHFDLAQTNDLLRDYCDIADNESLAAADIDVNAASNMFSDLTENEIKFLEKFLVERISDDVSSEGKDEGILDVSELDGFFTAIVSGPVVIHPSQWLMAVWGDFEPVWESEKQFEIVFSLMLRLMNSIASTLIEQPDNYGPLFHEKKIKGKLYIIVDEWCEGFRRGVSLAPEQWENAGGEMMMLLMPIYAFTVATDWRGHEFIDEEIKNLHDAIVLNVLDIHTYWFSRRDEPAPVMEPVRHTEPHIGRNDPCPCGSGKKYKKCCLH